MSTSWDDDEFIPEDLPIENQELPQKESENEQVGEELENARRQFGLSPEEQEENENDGDGAEYYDELQKLEESRLANEEVDIEEYDDQQYGHDYALTGKCSRKYGGND